MSLLIAIGIMVLVVVPLIGWTVWEDRRRQRRSEDTPGLRKEEVA